MPQGSFFSAGHWEDLRFNFAGIARSFAHRILLFSIKSSILCNSQRIHFGTIIFCMYHDVNLEDNRDNKKKHTLWGGLTVTHENPRGSLVMQETPGIAVLFCRLGFFFLAYASRSLRLRTKAAAKIATGNPPSPIFSAVLLFPIHGGVLHP